MKAFHLLVGCVLCCSCAAPRNMARSIGEIDPLPDAVFKAGVRTLPSMIAAVTTNNQSAWDSLGRFEKPFLVLSGERDQLLGRREVADRLITQVPGAKGQKHARFDAGHFIQDEIGETMATTLHAFIADNPRR